MQYGLIGEHLSHSYSPEIHAKIDNYTYELIEVEPEDLAGFLERRDFKGINVTIPYKQAVIPLLDWVSEDALKIGAVNTIVNRDGKLYGYNTDFDGMVDAIAKVGIKIEGKKVLVLGTGGTSNTARAVLEHLGAAEIILVSRCSTKIAVSYEEAAELHSDAQVIINTTPVGMFPREEGIPIDIAPYKNLEGIFDVLYNPIRTNLVLEGRDRGIPAGGGLYMLCAQAVYAASLFLDRDVIEGETARIYRELMNEKENIVLIGMPTSGKTTVGKMISAKVGKPFRDTDDIFSIRTSHTPAEYIQEYGEVAFRVREHDVIAYICDKAGSVIATGGGAILNPKNARLLERNGRLAFLDRSLENLSALADRPLSSDKDKLKAMFEQRRPIYMAAADLTIDADRTPEEICETLMKEFDYEDPRN